MVALRTAVCCVDNGNEVIAATVTTADSSTLEEKGAEKETAKEAAEARAVKVAKVAKAITIDMA